MTKPLFLLASTVLLANCSQQTASNPSISIDHLADLSGGKPVVAKEYRLRVVIEEKGKIVNESTLAARPGKEAKFSMTREFVYPSAYQLAAVSTLKVPASTSPRPYPVTPSTPKEFVTRDLGYTGSLTVKPEGGFLVIKGMLANESFIGFSRAPGEAISPIKDAKTRVTLTENRVDLPNFVRSETPVFIAGLPGVPHKIELPGVKGSVTITAEPVP
ncbi:hypothetical protein [Luteolibacter luteus]|uniref:Lipoprotein n=1 Tax=Luteolibacter luteus TaxID=2728835 RepID=A0A858RPG9_9BACT|nr:hypothetical protein [Luteolibacter luteus]QJE98635.1 hypothetical protein HHL09_23565 [Luteolibacter luteus]